jgi:SAM-dependent methyltransferase
MDPLKMTTIGHNRHALCSPLSSARLDELIAQLALPDGARVLDLCCGKGEIGLRIAARCGAHVLAVDRNPAYLEVVRGKAARLERGAVQTLVADAEHPLQEEPFDLVLCVGARPFGSFRDNLLALAAMTRPGGELMVGEGYWRSQPDPAYLAFLGSNEEEEAAVDTTMVHVGQEIGLRPLHLTTSTVGEFDAYDGLFRSEIERWLDRNPSDPDHETIRVRIEAWRDAWFRWGRSTMGFAFTVFLKPSRGLVPDAE